MIEKQQLAVDDVSSLLPLYSEIRELLSNNKFHKVYEKIDFMYTKQLSTVLLVGMPRLTFMWRKYLPSWDSWVCESIKRFDEMGEDGKKIMRGLY